MRASEQPLERHDLITLVPAWRALLLAPLEAGVIARVEAWQAAGHPLIVASRAHGDPVEALRLGLAGPDKSRLSLLVAPEAVAACVPPPLLARVAPACPPAWQGMITELEALAARHGLPLRVFGSAAWQALTGLPYLTPTSDLDLLVEPQTAEQREGVLAGLAAIKGPARLDGEVRLAGIGDVAWREWSSGAARVLAKTREGPRLIARQEAA